MQKLSIPFVRRHAWCAPICLVSRQDTRPDHHDCCSRELRQLEYPLCTAFTYLFTFRSPKPYLQADLTANHALIALHNHPASSLAEPIQAKPSSPAPRRQPVTETQANVDISMSNPRFCRTCRIRILLRALHALFCPAQRNPITGVEVIRETGGRGALQCGGGDGMG